MLYLWKLATLISSSLPGIPVYFKGLLRLFLGMANRIKRIVGIFSVVRIVDIDRDHVVSCKLVCKADILILIKTFKENSIIVLCVLCMKF